MNDKPKIYSIKEYILFKLDRNIAILGLVALGVIGFIEQPSGYEKIVSGIVAALAVYLGARGSK